MEIVQDVFESRTERRRVAQLFDRLTKREGHMDKEAIQRWALRRKNRDERKKAIVRVGNTRKIAYIDPKNYKAYKHDGCEPTWMRFKKWVFIKWAGPLEI